MADATLIVKVVTDYAEGAAGLEKAGGAAGKFQQRLSGLVAPAAAVVGAVGLFGKTAVDAASRTQQAMGAVDSVFGRNAAQVKRWADGAASSVGLAKSEYGELASVIGAQLKNMGVPMDQVAGQTNELVKLGADLAATYGGTTKEAVEALGSALRGETDPIERYGVSVKQADVAAQQAADGTDKLTGAAGKQAKTMALLELVNKQTADAQGQFARESDSAAGSAQIAAAQYEDMKSALGTALLPVVSSVARALGNLAGFMAKHRTATQVVIGVVFAMAAAILVLNTALTVYTAVTTLAASATLAAWAAALGPILLVIAAVGLVVAAVVILWKKSETFRKVVTAVWRAVRQGAITVANAVRTAWTKVWSAITTAARRFLAAVRSVWTAVRAAASATVERVKSLFSTLWERIKSGAKAMKDYLADRWSDVKSKVDTVVGAIKAVAGTMWEKVKAGAKGLGAILAAPFTAMKSAVDKVVGAVQSLISWLGKIKVPKISLPKIPGLSRSAAAPSPVGLAAGRFAAPAVPMGRAGVATGGAIVINVTGALDPEAVARQIKRIVGRHDSRVGLS